MPRLNNTEINEICTEWENDRLASPTIRMVAASLRELQRWREGMPEKSHLPGQHQNAR